MGEMLQAVTSWPALAAALIIFGFAPGVVPRTIVLIYPRSHSRRAELLGELYRYPRWERPFWVAEQFEVAIFEGLPSGAGASFANFERSSVGGRDPRRYPVA